MPEGKPLDLDDEDEPRPRRKRRPSEEDEDEGGRGRRRSPAEEPKPGEVAAGFFALAKWLSFGAGALLLVVALSQAAPWAAAFSGMACFAGIASRLAQAEEHHHRGRVRRD